MIKRLNDKKDKSGIKRIMKKNQVVILALALMLMTAGYMNYTNNHENENLLLAQLGDAKLVSANVTDENNLDQNILSEVQNELNQTENIEANNISNSTIDNTVNIENGVVNDITNEVNANEANVITETSNNNVESKDDYFAKSKLERETMYSQMLETYEGILENEKIPSDQKDIAENEIKNINDKKNAIMIVENLLQTKGFDDAVVLINDQSVNVVIKKEKLETQEVAQIQNIIQRELKTDIENIHISSNK